MKDSGFESRQEQKNFSPKRLDRPIQPRTQYIQRDASPGASPTAEVKKSKAVTPLPLYDFGDCIEKLQL